MIRVAKCCVLDILVRKGRKGRKGVELSCVEWCWCRVIGNQERKFGKCCVELCVCVYSLR